MLKIRILPCHVVNLHEFLILFYVQRKTFLFPYILLFGKVKALFSTLTRKNGLRIVFGWWWSGYTSGY